MNGEGRPSAPLRQQTVTYDLQSEFRIQNVQLATAPYFPFINFQDIACRSRA